MSVKLSNARRERPRYRFRGDLPQALAHIRGLPVWVCWDFRWKVNRWTKPPFNARTGGHASVSAPRTWATFDQALAGMQRYGFAGVGLVLTPEVGITGFDIDHCITDAGSLSPLAAEVICLGETYAEVSPSGEGLRGLARGAVAAAVKDDALGVEVYDRSRFLTITGNHIPDTPNEIREAPQTLARLIAAVEERRGASVRLKPNGHHAASGDFFRNVNAAALARLDEWVPRLHPTARKYPNGAWRVSSQSLGRALEEDLSYHATGVADFGEEHGLSPIDAVQRFGDATDAKAAALWLCQTMCIEPASLGARGGVNGATPPPTTEEWPDPVPLPTSLLPVAPFDFDMLPEMLRPWVEDVAERMQCPPDFVAVTSMTALGSVIGRKVSVRPQLADDWTVVPNVWGLLIGPPGIMKSPAQSEGLRPLKLLAAAAREEFNIAKAEYDIQAAVAKVQSEAAKKEAAKALAKDPNAQIEDLLRPRQSPEEEPVLRRYITSNATYEALAVLMQQNPNGLLVDRDEMLSLLDRLDEEGHADERGFYLSGWNGDTAYTVDRIGRGLDMHVPAVCVSMIGGTQPARISQYLAQVRRGGRGNDGLIQRFGLMVWPDISRAWKNVDRKPNSDARNTAFRAFQRLDALDWRAIGGKRDRNAGGDETGQPYLRFSPKARERFVAWRTDLEHRLRQGTLDAMLESHLAKYRKLVPGLALVIHLTDFGTGEVSDAAIERALKWARYLETHAARVYASTSIAAADAARAIMAKVRSGHLQQTFKAREIVRAQWSRLSDPETVRAALQLLVDHDWLSVATVATGGRKATVYKVSPKAILQEV